MRSPLAPAFVTSALASGCAWSYGAGAQYLVTTAGSQAVELGARGALGLGARNDSLTVGVGLHVGVGASPRTVSFHSETLGLYTWLPSSERPVGLRLGAGTLVGNTPRDGLLVAPVARAELLIPVARGDRNDDVRVTSLAVGLTAGYDVSASLGGTFVLSVTLDRSGNFPFGNPPPPRRAPPPDAPLPP